MSEKIITKRSGDFVRDYLTERGTDVPITEEVERISAEITSNPNPSEALKRLSETSPEKAFVVANFIASDAEETGLQHTILETIEQGIDKAEPDQLPDRLSLLGNMTGRSRAGLTEIPEDKIRSLAMRVLEKNRNRIPLAGEGTVAKIINDLS